MSRTTYGAPATARQVSASTWRRRDGWIPWAGVVASVGVHAVVLLGWPMTEVSYESSRLAEPMAPLLMPLIALRQPEEALTPPAAPEAVEAASPRADRTLERPALPPELKLDAMSIPKLAELPTWEEPLVPPAPPIIEKPVADEWSTYEPVAAATVQPDIRNRSEVRRFLERRYQPILSATGATGSTMLRFWIDEVGVAQRILMVGSSGHERLDELALSVAQVIRFKPAVLAGAPIRVVVDVPIRFQAMRLMGI